ncbi:MAG: T9SS type A sorting domain-containing protein [Saprospiraceae bacterium]|nr:T9SS type A sorting domain-containing protein [Saprospiraceae bacterium]
MNNLIKVIINRISVIPPTNCQLILSSNSKFLSLLIGILLNSLNLNGQSECTANFFLQTHGFGCSNRTGSICFVTSPSWSFSPSNPCTNHNYRFELEYPTGSFNYTDLQDFSLFSTNSNSIVLIAPISIQSEGTNSECLLGIEVIPNTVYTIRVRDLTNNELVNSNTFQLSGNYTTIGTTGGTILLSQAITQNNLLPASQSSGHSQKVIINGQLLIDENYIFGNSSFTNGMLISNELIMGPNAEIIILPGYQLEFNLANIYGCQTTWNRILVQSGSSLNFTRVNISDATTAIQIEDFGNVNIAITNFLNNEVGIGVYGSLPKTIQLNIFSGQGAGTLFSSNSDDKFGLNSGCRFENIVNNIIIDGYITFSNLHTGIYNWHTSLEVYAANFYNTTYGIINGNESQTLRIGTLGNNFGAYFKDNYTAITTYGSSITNIFKTNIDNCTYGITKLSGTYNEITEIADNEIRTDQNSILAILFPSIYGNIKSNLIYGNHESNIWLYGKGAGDHLWDVQYNSELLALDGSNCTMNNISKTKFFHNLNVNSIANGTNVDIDGGTSNWVGYNQVDCYDGGSNVRVSGSPQVNVYCNTLNNDQLDNLNLNLDCAGAEIKGNDFSSSTYNLVYGSPSNSYVISGEQLFKGNLFDASSSSYKKAQDYAMTNISPFNKFLVDGTQGGPYFPFFNSAYQDWFRSQFGTNYICPPVLVGGPTDQFEAAIITRINLFTSGFYNGNNSSEQFDAILKNFRDLDSYQRNGGEFSSAMTSWYNTYQNSESYILFQHEKAIREAFTMSQSLKDQIKSLNDSVNTLTSLLSQLIHYTMNFDGQITYLEPQHSQYLSYTSQLNSINNQIIALHKSFNLQNEVKLNQLLSTNAALATVTNMGSNLKKIWNYTLKSMQEVFISFNTAEMDELNNIAQHCPYDGGEGVLHARSIIANQTKKGSEYNDNCVVSNRSNKEAKQSLSSCEIQVHPNPVSTYLTILFPKKSNINYLELKDLSGKLVWSALNLKENHLVLNTDFLANGIYILSSADTKEQLKVAILHN